MTDATGEYDRLLYSLHRAQEYPVTLLRRDNHEPTLKACGLRLRRRRQAFFLSDKQQDYWVKKGRDLIWVTIRDYGFAHPDVPSDEEEDVRCGSKAASNVKFRQMALRGYDKMTYRLEWPHNPETPADSNQSPDKECMDAKHTTGFKQQLRAAKRKMGHRKGGKIPAVSENSSPENTAPESNSSSAHNNSTVSRTPSAQNTSAEVGTTSQNPGTTGGQGSGPAEATSLTAADPPKIRPDPKCRIIIIPAVNSKSDILRADEHMMLSILTYHQVPHCYLDAVLSLRLCTSASDLQIGGFKAICSIASPCQKIEQLNRTGSHYELCFCLQTIQNHSEREGNVEDLKHAAAIYHKFDVKKGTSLWIINSQEEQVFGKDPANYVWKAVKETINSATCASQLEAEDISERFAASLKVLRTLAVWSLGTCPFYLTTLEEHLAELTERHRYNFFEDDDPDKLELIDDDSRAIASIIDDLQDCGIRLKNDKRVLQSLIDFYSKTLLADISSPGMKIDNAQCYVDELVAELNAIIVQIKDCLERWKNLNELARNKERMIQQLLQNTQSKQMANFTKITTKDSTAMRNFGLITLFLLPITVISAILSTDVIKFQGFDNDPAAEAKGYKFSSRALASLAISAAVLTLICLSFSKLSGDKILIVRAAYWLRDWARAKLDQLDQLEPPAGKASGKPNRPRENGSLPQPPPREEEPRPSAPPSPSPSPPPPPPRTPTRSKKPEGLTVDPSAVSPGSESSPRTATTLVNSTQLQTPRSFGATRSGDECAGAAVDSTSGGFFGWLGSFESHLGRLRWGSGKQTDEETGDAPPRTM